MLVDATLIISSCLQCCYNARCICIAYTDFWCFALMLITHVASVLCPQALSRASVLVLLLQCVLHLYCHLGPRCKRLVVVQRGVDGCRGTGPVFSFHVCEEPCSSSQQFASSSTGRTHRMITLGVHLTNPGFHNACWGQRHLQKGMDPKSFTRKSAPHAPHARPHKLPQRSLTSVL